MALGIPSLKIKNMFESNPLKLRFLVRELTVSPNLDGSPTLLRSPAKCVHSWATAVHIRTSEPPPAVGILHGQGMLRFGPFDICKVWYFGIYIYIYIYIYILIGVFRGPLLGAPSL